MKKTILTLTTTTVLMLAIPAYADNDTVENALERRADVSQFYQALVNSGVIDELREDRSYTVFAPTNKAFSKLSIPAEGCYSSPDCREEVANVLRHHIVEGEQHLSDKSAVFSIDEYHINIGKPFKERYTVDGHRVISTHQLTGNMLYRINGVIMNKEERVAFLASERNAFAPAADGETRVRTDKVYYAPSGRVDGYKQTTTY